MSKSKTLIPNEFRDYVYISSFLGFLGIFALYILGSSYLSENFTPITLLVGGVGMLIAGKVLTLKDWAKDGIQSNELTLILSLVIGLVSIILGVMGLVGYPISSRYDGLIGTIALFPAVYIALEYFAKNTR